MEASGSSVYLQTKTSYVAAVNIFFSPDAFSRAQTCDSIDSQLCTDSASDRRPPLSRLPPAATICSTNRPVRREMSYSSDLLLAAAEEQTASGARW